MHLLDLVALYITPQQTSVAFGYIRQAAASGDPRAGACGNDYAPPPQTRVGLGVVKLLRKRSRCPKNGRRPVFPTN